MTLPETFPPVAVVTRLLADVYGLRGAFHFRVLSDGVAPPVLVEADGVRRILRSQKLSTLADHEIAAARASVLLGATARGAPVTGLLVTRDGSPVHVERVGDTVHALCMYEFVDGRAPSPSEATFRRLGAHLASLHLAFEAGDALLYRLPRLGRAELLDLPARAIRPRLRRAAATLDRAVELLEPDLDRFEAELALTVCHGDAHHHNCQWTATDELRFLDFEHVSVGWRSYDLATLLWGTLGGSSGPAVWSAAVQGYSEVQRLTDQEAAAIPPLMACRHIWWLGWHAQHWGRWRRTWMTPDFFDDSLELVRRLLVEACGRDW
ncbi:MAG TPA: phosphotransferase [Nannocystis sp.]